MNIWITNIKIQSISSIGSFNVGKTILCKNESVAQTLTGDDVTPDPEIPEAALPEPAVVPQAEIQAPTIGQLPIQPGVPPAPGPGAHSTP